MFLDMPETPKSSRSKNQSQYNPGSSRQYFIFYFSKKISVVNRNNDIVFNHESRFGVDRKKYHEQVSYLRNRSFEFKTPRSKFYRGAGFGFGGKTDFAK